MPPVVITQISLGTVCMALFGLAGEADHGAHAALNRALRMLENLERLNRELAAELSEPMIIGVGIHTGDAVIGKMGPPRSPSYPPLAIR